MKTITDTKCMLSTCWVHISYVSTTNYWDHCSVLPVSAIHVWSSILHGELFMLSKCPSLTKIYYSMLFFMSKYAMTLYDCFHDRISQSPWVGHSKLIRISFMLVWGSTWCIMLSKFNYTSCLSLQSLPNMYYLILYLFLMLYITFQLPKEDRNCHVWEAPA